MIKIKQDKSKSIKKRDRQLLGVAGGIFVLSVWVFGGFSYRQNQAAQSQAAQSQPLPPPPKAGAGWAAPDASPEVKAEYAERAKMLRAQFEPWARAHQAELRRMISAGPDNIVARDAVWEALPINSDKIGFTSEKVTSGEDALNSVGFGWYPTSKILRTAPKSGGPQEQMNQKTEGLSQGQVQRDFKKRRDIAIAGSAKGQTMTYLWASGRVTQITALEEDVYLAMARRAYAEGRPEDAKNTWGPHREMAPPYNFLTSSAGESR